MDTFLTIASKRDQRQFADRDIPSEVRDRILGLVKPAQNRYARAAV